MAAGKRLGKNLATEYLGRCSGAGRTAEGPRAPVLALTIEVSPLTFSSIMGGLRLRILLVSVVAFVVALFALPAFADEPARVRVGTSVAAEATVERVDPPETHQPPGDAPRTESGLKLPSPPPNFNTVDGGWIRFAYEPSVRERVQPLITSANETRADLVERLGRSVLDHVTVYVARTPGEMAGLAPEGAPFPKYADGVAYPDIGLVLLTIHPVEVNAHHDLAEVFRHELAHVALFDSVGGRPVPRWFNEGFAVFASGESSFTRLQTLWTATMSEELIPLRRMERTFPSDAVGVSVAYAQAADVVRFLVRRQDHERFVGMIERVRHGQDFEHSMRDSYGLDLETLEYEWREDVARRYTFWPILFSGSVVWVGAIGLFFVAWRRRKKRDKVTLQRWEREEVEEEVQRRLRESRELEQGRVHIVLAPRGAAELRPPPLPDAEIPKVEHDGHWYTLH